MLELKNLFAGYTKNNDILKGIDLSVNDNEVAAIIGQNGSGKSTLAKSIMGMVPYIHGEILFEGNSLNKKTSAQISDLGIGFFMQGGRIFSNLTVEENLDFAGSLLSKNEIIKRKNEVKGYFELLKNNSRNKLKASYLSGGEQQQLALAMVLMRKPKLLILDEPSAGLSPSNVEKIFEILKEIKKYVKNILLIEQNITSSIAFSHRVLLVQEGIIALDEEFGNNNVIYKIENLLFNKK